MTRFCRLVTPCAAATIPVAPVVKLAIGFLVGRAVEYHHQSRILTTDGRLYRCTGVLAEAPAVAFGLAITPMVWVAILICSGVQAVISSNAPPINPALMLCLTVVRI